MDLRDYQRRASETSQLRLGGPHAAMAPLLGLAGETGSILDIYKKYLRDGIDLAVNRELLHEELGDLVDAWPNTFPDAYVHVEGRRRGYQVGLRLGDPLSDNSRNADSYRFHDAIHFGFLAVLGWSPNLRSLLGIKRKSDPTTDECEDGARAIFAEEGLAAVLSRLATRRAGFATGSAVTGEVIDVARAATTDLEVQVLPGWLWRRAICQGFAALRGLADNSGGFLIADLDARELSYAKYLAGAALAVPMAEAT